MATFLSEEESGFFNAVETTLEDGTKEYDRVYDSEQFCKYFSLFVGNGVFISPENQLMVSSGESIGSIGRNIVVNTGWAFINGMFYHNKEQGVLEINPNTSGATRKDGVFCRYNKGSRSINILVEEGRITPKRLEYDYELLLAIVEVGSNVSTITNANITDTRPDEQVCGFVKGLVDVIETDQLFQQFQAQFGEWFQNLQEFFGSDALGTVMSKLQNLETGKADTETTDDLQEQIDRKAFKSAVYEMEIQSANWSTNNTAPFTNEMEVEGVTESNIVEIGLSENATSNQVKAWNNANIVDGGQSEGSITLRAWGMKPTENIPVNVIVRGDV